MRNEMIEVGVSFYLIIDIAVILNDSTIADGDSRGSYEDEYQYDGEREDSDIESEQQSTRSGSHFSQLLNHNQITLILCFNQKVS